MNNTLLQGVSLRAPVPPVLGVDLHYQTVKYMYGCNCYVYFIHVNCVKTNQYVHSFVLNINTFIV